LLDAVVAGAVDLQDVERIAGGDFFAIVAGIVGSNGRSLLAIERFGQNSRGRRFPDAARAHKEVGMGQAILRHRILEGARDVGLADQIVKRLWPIFSRENFVAHALNLNALRHRRK